MSSVLGLKISGGSVTLLSCKTRTGRARYHIQLAFLKRTLTDNSVLFIYHSIGPHVEHHQLRRTNRVERLDAVHDTAVQHPQPVTPVRPDPEHGHQTGTVWTRRSHQIAAGRVAMPFPVWIRLYDNDEIFLPRHNDNEKLLFLDR